MCEAPFVNRLHDGGESVIADDDLGGAPGDFGAGAVHRYAHVGPRQRERVVHAVASHGDEALLRLKRFHDSQILRGMHAGEDRDAVQVGAEILVRHRLQFGTGLGDVARACDVERGGNGQARALWQRFGMLAHREGLARERCLGGLERGELAERFHGALHAPLLHRADQRIEQDHVQDHASIATLPHGECDDRRNEQDVDERADELPR
jgi:hypothetical protein